MARRAKAQRQIYYGASLARSLRRRRRKTFLPEVLALRARNPCVFARLRFLGCHVRFMRSTILIIPTKTTRKYFRCHGENLAQHMFDQKRHNVVVIQVKIPQTSRSVAGHRKRFLHPHHYPHFMNSPESKASPFLTKYRAYNVRTRLRNL